MQSKLAYLEHGRLHQHIVKIIKYLIYCRSEFTLSRCECVGPML